jgi:hypothetical protein
MAKMTNLKEVLVIIPSPTSRLVFSRGGKRRVYTREYFDSLYEIIVDAIKSYSPQIRCSRSFSQSHKIDSEVIRGIANADIAIAVVTGRSSNIFWQLGIRHALREGTIILQDSRDESPLGLVGYASHSYQIEDADGAENLKSLVREKIGIYDKVPFGDSPVQSILGSEFAELLYRKLSGQTLAEKKDTDAVTILFLAADPTDASRLRLGEELREIQGKLLLAKLRERFDLHQRLSVRPSDIIQALLDVQPSIIHFSGHGVATGALCFENQLGETLLVHPDALAALFEQFSNQVNCVLLNACYSEIQAAAIAKHVNYVIGMNKAIGDKAAIAFSIGFYQALGAGRAIEQAYKLGCVQIRLYGIPEHLTPVLIRGKQ